MSKASKKKLTSLQLEYFEWLYNRATDDYSDPADRKSYRKLFMHMFNTVYFFDDSIRLECNNIGRCFDLRRQFGYEKYGYDRCMSIRDALGETTPVSFLEVFMSFVEYYRTMIFSCVPGMVITEQFLENLGIPDFTDDVYDGYVADVTQTLASTMRREWDELGAPNCMFRLKEPIPERYGGDIRRQDMWKISNQYIIQWHDEIRDLDDEYRELAKEAGR